MIESLFKAAFPTLAVLTLNLIIKDHKSPWMYVFLFIILTFTNYAFSSDLNRVHKYLDFPHVSAEMTESEKLKYEKLMNYHFTNINNLAKSSKEWLYKVKEKMDENEYGLTEAAICAVSTGAATRNIHAAALVAVIDLIHNTLKCCYKAQCEIRLCMLSSEYHLEMANFYKSLIEEKSIRE